MYIFHAFAVKIKIWLWNIQHLRPEILHVLDYLQLKHQHWARQPQDIFFFSFGLKPKFMSRPPYTAQKNLIQLRINNFYIQLYVEIEEDLDTNLWGSIKIHLFLSVGEDNLKNNCTLLAAKCILF